MSNSIPFQPANILLPKDNFEKWAVIACDQFTSDQEYWEKTKQNVGSSVSTLKITLPEIYLEEKDVANRIKQINTEMSNYISSGVFTEYKNSMIYIERIQPDGRIRQGIVGAVDLESYDYAKNAKTMIRATEGTVLERIPPRVRIRENAPLEVPHVMLLIDDKKQEIIEPLKDQKNQMKKLYDFDLMMGGGHISGYLMNEKDIERISGKLKELCDEESDPLLFAVGDGNHSLATAKACYEAIKKDETKKAKNELSRYALAEIGNIHSEALDFEPIYRVMFNINQEDVIKELHAYFKEESTGTEIKYYYGTEEGTIKINIPNNKLVTGVIQEFIDYYSKKHCETKMDYIHGIKDVQELAKKDGAIGFIYDGISKDTLFDSVKASGALPRKTFSMGEARDKRYYLECRKIK